MRHLVFDIETDGHLETLTKIHSLVLRDWETDEVVASCSNDPRWKGPSIEHGLSLLSGAEIIFGHSILDFDMRAIKKVYPWFEFKGRMFDTLVAARLRWAHIKETDFALLRKGKLHGSLVGRHSLKAWGQRTGVVKGDYTDWCTANGIADPWSEWRPEMQAYCERDTLVTRHLLTKIKKAGYSRQALDMEHELQSFLSAMEDNGWPFNEAKAHELHAHLAAKRELAAQRLRDIFGQIYVREGSKLFVPKRDNKKRGLYAGAPSCKIKPVDFNPGSRHHIADRLIKLYGWKPEVFTEGGDPKLDDDTIRALPYAETEDIATYLLLDKRIGQLAEGKKAWLTYVTRERETGGKITGIAHIHGSVNPGGTVTHRASHMRPNIAQVPKVISNKQGAMLRGIEGRYGTDSRELFIVPRGWQMMGADMSGLELRVLAHYMAKWDGGSYGKVLLEGDPHTVNYTALGWPPEPADGRKLNARSEIKTWFYAYLYGAGDEKLGSIEYPLLLQDGQIEKGKLGRKKFEGGLPALGYLVERLKEKAKEQGWIELIDGRRAYVRHEHAVLNTLLQGTGAVLCKHWVVEFSRRMTARFGPQGWNGQWAALGWIHDEIQIAVREGIGEEVMRIAVESAEAMTEKFAFRIPLTGEAKLGCNWAETH
jgi:DNA polymerase-1